MSDFIKVYKNVLDPKFCDIIVSLFDTSPYKQDGTTSGGIDISKKNSIDLKFFMYDEYEKLNSMLMDVTYKMFLNYIDEYYFMIISTFDLTLHHPITKEPVHVTAENYHEVARPQLPLLVQKIFDILPPQAQKYAKGVGGYPYWHSETYPKENDQSTIHRALLYIYYLNDVEEGGETEFYYQNTKVKPSKGDMVIAPCYFTHTHRGNIPISNDKYILTSWLQYKDSSRLYK
jgi:hypothetical protein